MSTIFDFFLGDAPATDTVAYNIYYIARILIGIMFLTLILDLFKMLKRLF